MFVPDIGDGEGAGGSSFLGPSEAVLVEPKFPASHKYSESQVAAVRQGLNQARHYLSNRNCAMVFAQGDDDPSLTAISIT
jgi:hypothetical protein